MEAEFENRQIQFSRKFSHQTKNACDVARLLNHAAVLQPPLQGVGDCQGLPKFLEPIHGHDGFGGKSLSQAAAGWPYNHLKVEIMAGQALAARHICSCRMNSHFSSVQERHHLEYATAPACHAVIG
jgi:hypothetical protein